MVYQQSLSGVVSSEVTRFVKMALWTCLVLIAIWTVSYVSHWLLSVLPLWAWWCIGFIGFLLISGFAARDAYLNRGAVFQSENWISEAKVSMFIVFGLYLLMFFLISILYYLSAAIHGIGQAAYDEWFFWTVLVAIVACYHYRGCFKGLRTAIRQFVRG